MKIVQSYWSKPSLKASNFNPNDRNLGGWSEKKYNYMSWTLSCLQLRTFYGDIELVTDELGYKLLIEQLDLPYSSVNVVLDNLNHYHTDLWALGKLYAYGLQESPFIHVDGDVFIWDRFNTEMENASLCAQSYEIDEPGYEHVHDFVKTYFRFFPDFMDNTGKNHIESINAGIIGGNNINFFKEYTTIAFEFIDRNLDKMQGLDIGAFNMFYEQYLFFCLAKHKEIEINYLIDDRRKLLDEYVNFTGVPVNTKYIHTIGPFKKRLETGKLLEHTLKTTYPERYYQLISLLKQQLI